MRDFKKLDAAIAALLDSGTRWDIDVNGDPDKTSAADRLLLLSKAFRMKATYLRDDMKLIALLPDEKLAKAPEIAMLRQELLALKANIVVLASEYTQVFGSPPEALSWLK